MLCEAAAAVAAELAVDEGWVVLVTEVDVVADVVLPCAVALVAAV